MQVATLSCAGADAGKCSNRRSEWAIPTCYVHAMLRTYAQRYADTQMVVRKISGSDKPFRCAHAKVRLAGACPSGTFGAS